nr:Ig-like domain-containing protein [Streptomyces violaceusniger]
MRTPWSRTAGSVPPPYNSAVSGQSVTLTATVIPLGAGTPTGPVTFTLTNGVGTITSSPTLDTNGFAFLEVALSAGNWDVGAVYEGDANFGASGVSEYTQVVTAPDNGTVTSTTS